MNLGIKEENILVTGIVKNTFDEVEEISKLVPMNSSVILVTSSIHMHR